MNINTKALKGIIDEIEASRSRQKAETEFQREALRRAVKNHQLDAKAIRIVLQRRAMGQQKRDEQDYYVHAYEHALGGKKAAMEALERGASVREAAAAGGISTGAAGNLAKTVQKSSFVDTSHDADGVITETAPASQPLSEPASGARSDAITETAASPPPAAGEAREIEGSPGTPAAILPRDDVLTRPFAKEITNGCNGASVLGVTSTFERITPSDDGMDPPPFLSRRKTAAEAA